MLSMGIPKGHEYFTSYKRPSSPAEVLLMLADIMEIHDTDYKIHEFYKNDKISGLKQMWLEENARDFASYTFKLQGDLLYVYLKYFKKQDNPLGRNSLFECETGKEDVNSLDVELDTDCHDYFINCKHDGLIEYEFSDFN